MDKEIKNTQREKIIFAKLESWKQELINVAEQATSNVYSPISKYHVGAAIKSKNGKIFKGVNIENIAFTSTVCAERAALFNAVSNGEKKLETIAIIAKDPITPCGVCRQVLFEFNPKMLIIVSNLDKSIIKEYILTELLPYGFGPKDAGYPHVIDTTE